MGQKHNTSSTNTTESSNNQGPSRKFLFQKRSIRQKSKRTQESPVNWMQVSYQSPSVVHQFTYLHWYVWPPLKSTVYLSGTLEKLLKCFKDSEISDEESSLRFDRTVPLTSTCFDPCALTTCEVKLNVLN